MFNITNKCINDFILATIFLREVKNREVSNSTQSNIELVNYNKFIQNYPLIIYNVTDETGKSKKGKLSLVQVPL